MFIQLVKFQTDHIEEIQKLSDEMRANSPGRLTTVRRLAACKDRDRDDGYVVIAEFESYEEAMRNSEDPDMQEFSAKMRDLHKGTTEYINLDVIEVTEPTPA